MFDYTKSPRFWSKVDIGADSACWEWKRFRNRLGYGRVLHDGKVRQAHRVAWIHSRGEIPDGLNVLHKCDNRACCNPSHLFLGTQADNVKDMIVKGRRRTGAVPKGEDCMQAKITTADVIEIRRLSSAGFSHSQIAKQFNICFQQVSRIVRRERWRHVS